MPNLLKKFLGVSFVVVGMFSLEAYAGGKLDKSHIYTGSMAKSTALHVHLFSTDGADLGNPKFRDTAQTMAKSAPHILAADIVETLRGAGFTAISLDETEGEPTANALNLRGRFTRLDPGSQNLRVWVGFGAGESKVCVEGEISDAKGVKLADFSDCRKGLGWGASGPQGDKSAKLLGGDIAAFVAGWANKSGN